MAAPAQAASAQRAARDGGCMDDTRWIVFVIGSSASGKTVTAKYLADVLHAKYLEGDDVIQPAAPFPCPVCEIVPPPS